MKKMMIYSRDFKTPSNCAMETLTFFFFFFFKLRKGAYPYEYIDGWEIFKETSLPGGGKRFTAT